MADEGAEGCTTAFVVVCTSNGMSLYRALQAGPGMGRAAGRGLPVAAPGQAPAVSCL